MNKRSIPAKPALALEPHHPAPPPAVPMAQPMTPMELISSALHRGASIEQVGQLIALKERMEADEARKAFVSAMTEFKRHPPSITKTKKADVTGREGRSSFSYLYAGLADVVGAITESLASVGISHEWTTAQAGQMVTVTCTLTHELGHAKSTTLTASADTTGGKNAIQAVGSAVTYLERYTLLAVCGIAVEDGSDNDGKGNGLDPDAVRKSVDERRAREQKGSTPAPLLTRARGAADQGRRAFEDFWATIRPAERNMLRSEMNDLERRAKQADHQPTGDFAAQMDAAAQQQEGGHQ